MFAFASFSHPIFYFHFSFSEIRCFYWILSSCIVDSVLIWFWICFVFASIAWQLSWWLMLFLVLVGIILSDLYIIVRLCLLNCFRSFDLVGCCFNDMFALFLSILGMNIKIAIVSSPFSFLSYLWVFCAFYWRHICVCLALLNYYSESGIIQSNWKPEKYGVIRSVKILAQLKK